MGRPQWPASWVAGGLGGLQWRGSETKRGGLVMRRSVAYCLDGVQVAATGEELWVERFVRRLIERLRGSVTFQIPMIPALGVAASDEPLATIPGTTMRRLAAALGAVLQDDPNIHLEFLIKDGVAWARWVVRTAKHALRLEGWEPNAPMEPIEITNRELVVLREIIECVEPAEDALWGLWATGEYCIVEMSAGQEMLHIYLWRGSPLTANVPRCPAPATRQGLACAKTAARALRFVERVALRDPWAYMRSSGGALVLATCRRSPGATVEVVIGEADSNKEIEVSFPTAWLRSFLRAVECVEESPELEVWMREVPEYPDNYTLLIRGRDLIAWC